ncbi:MAG: hypothetical protein KGL95_14400 [Patescibacteria group bacterium]|nr:hypothetical protein [Patescibacteria group bacterium]
MGNFRELASLSANTLNAFLVPTTDVSSFKWISLHLLTSTFTGTITFQGSNDGVTFKPVQLFQGDTLSVNANNIANASNLIFHGPIYYRYFNVQVTNYVSGIQTAVLELYETPAWSWPSIVALGTGFNVIGTTGVAFLNPGGGTLETVHDNWDNITVQTLTAQGAGTVNSTLQTNNNARGVMVTANVTSVTGSITVHIQAVDPVSSNATDLLVSTALAAVAKTSLFVYPGITASANIAASQILTRSWQISSVIVTGPVSAVISASLVL